MAFLCWVESPEKKWSSTTFNQKRTLDSLWLVKHLQNAEARIQSRPPPPTEIESMQHNERSILVFQSFYQVKSP